MILVIAIVVLVTMMFTVRIMVMVTSMGGIGVQPSEGELRSIVNTSGLYLVGRYYSLVWETKISGWELPGLYLATNYNNSQNQCKFDHINDNDNTNGNDE